MSGRGQDIIEIGIGHVGQRYVLGAHVPLDNPGWRGPWDCAEFVSWCVYQSYGLIFGAGHVQTVAKADPYSGAWYDEARRYATAIAWQDALSIPGAVLVRQPTSRAHGHVAISMGDGDRTLEARGAAFGVGIFEKAKSRLWAIGCLLPGVDYGIEVAPPPPKPAPVPPDYLWLRRPNIKSSSVITLQRALLDKGIHPGPVDGEFGPMTSSAVVCFQLEAGIEVDGVVGPITAQKLGLSFPITPTAGDVKIYAQLHGPQTVPKVDLPPPSAAFDGVASIARRGNIFSAKTGSGAAFVLGSQTRYTDDMDRVGLGQTASAIKDSMQFGAYQAKDFPELGQWAFFIEPTLQAEGGRYATLNTYDRAAFTFGAPQLAAHTPDKNFIEYFRKLLELPDADKHFPDLRLMANVAGRMTVHHKKGDSFEDLEEVVMVKRPNGVNEKQLARLMAYLNASPTEVDVQELTGAARLMNWLRLDPRAKKLQIETFVAIMKDNLATAKKKVRGFTGKDWRVALWIMDILHQGRGTYLDIASALNSASPEAGLMGIGRHTYAGRIKIVAQAVLTLDKSGKLNGFEV